MIFAKLSFKLVLILTFSTAILSSCINLKTETSDPDAFNEETLNMPKEESDGRLSLKISLENSEKNCYFPGGPIPIVVEYQNLTSITFQIVDYDVVSINPLIGAKAQIFPRIYKDNGQEIFTQEHLTYSQYGYTKETKANSLEPNDTMRVLIETYFFPAKIMATNATGDRQNITPPSGIYLIQFGYVNIGNSEYWEGSISSNVIEICIE